MKNKRIYVAGQEGMVGSAIYDLLKKKKYNLIDCPRAHLNLLSQKDLAKWFSKNKPDIVVHAAGKVGGVLDNKNKKDSYLYENSIIGLNLINQSIKNNVNSFINLGSACIYPKQALIPINENQLLTSQLEETNEGYALAKICVLKYCEYIFKKYNKYYISLMPANLYGPNDNFNSLSSHVIAALVKKFCHSVKSNNKSVEVWGTGNAKREFLHTSDFANAVLFCLRNKIKYPYLNVGSKDFLSIKSLANLIKEVSNFKGKIIYNRKYPEGVSIRKLDDKKLRKLGWKQKIYIKKEIINYYNNYYKSLI